jgi:hypothetical protein
MKINLTNQDGTLLMSVGREPLTDGAADFLSGGGELTTDAPAQYESDEDLPAALTTALCGLTMAAAFAWAGLHAAGWLS